MTAPNAIDLFCRIYAQSEQSHSEFVSFVAGSVKGSARGNAIRTPSLDISIDENDVFDLTKAHIHRNRWLYFRYMLEIDPVDDRVASDACAEIVGALLRAFWIAGMDAVAACEFEELLPLNERRAKWNGS